MLWRLLRGMARVGVVRRSLLVGSMKWQSCCAKVVSTSGFGGSVHGLVVPVPGALALQCSLYLCKVCVRSTVPHQAVVALGTAFSHLLLLGCP